MSLQIYNSLTQKKEPFVTIEPQRVRMYVCGPTVYGFLHVGNFRGPIFFNMVRNWLEKSGFEVRFVLNYTDVDDKIINRANEEKVSAEEISKRYIAEFEKDFAAIGLRKHSANPTVTEHMGDILALVQKLVDEERAYVVNGDVIFAIDQFQEYGKLSHRDVEELRAGSRVEINDKKRNPLDFVLWKAAKPGEPQWDSPWGPGRPGWHIECSAMVKALLGDQIDIHGGGSDLIFPHHENEIAQSEGATGCVPFARYWMHNNMLTFGQQKMSKSLGNIRTARSFLEEYNAEILKYMMLSVHYRSLLDFSEEAIHRSLSGLARIYSAMALAEKIGALGLADESATDEKFAQTLAQAQSGVAQALNDDFNTAEAFARIFEVVRSFNAIVRPVPKPLPVHAAIARQFLTWVRQVGEVMSLFAEPSREFLYQLDDLLLEQKQLKREAVQQLVDQRTQARTAKDFKEADRLRGELVGLGILLNDSPQGTEWEVQK